jgi:amidophosphoribosyltransferase
MTHLRAAEIHDEMDGDTLHEECGVFGISGTIPMPRR